MRSSNFPVVIASRSELRGDLDAVLFCHSAPQIRCGIRTALSRNYMISVALKLFGAAHCLFPISIGPFWPARYSPECAQLTQPSVASAFRVPKIESKRKSFTYSPKSLYTRYKYAVIRSFRIRSTPKKKKSPLCAMRIL